VLAGSGPDGSGEGVVETPLGSLLVAVRPILKTNGSGPANGSVLLARWID
jgi:hypothetical protein